MAKERQRKIYEVFQFFSVEFETIILRIRPHATTETLQQACHKLAEQETIEFYDGIF